jgi:hypothetical protein
LPGFSIQIVSDTVTAKLLAAKAEIQKAIATALEEAGTDMEAHSRQLVPVRTGHLQSSIYHTVDGMQLELGADADYTFFRGMWHAENGRGAVHSPFGRRGAGEVIVPCSGRDSLGVPVVSGHSLIET